MIEKIISGGQTGADQAGLRAAKAVGLATGGWLPQGCITLDGPRPDLLEIYSMQEHPKKGYPARTEANVRDSDGTIRFAEKFGSPGEKCTLKAIHWFRKPYLDIPILAMYNGKEWVAKAIGYSPADVLAWVKENNIRVLNVAGNSEQTCKGIGDVVHDFLVKVFGVTHD
jgi:hypothetical protein